jgi:ApaG protein
MKNSQNNIKIDIRGEYVPELSNNEDSLFYFSYKVSIYNLGSNKVQLLSRHWNIQDGLGRKKTIKGEGVIGKKPIIDPGESYEYKSYCPLETEFGSMNGFYTMKDEEGHLFKTLVPDLGLFSPGNVN